MKKTLIVAAAVVAITAILFGISNWQDSQFEQTAQEMRANVSVAVYGNVDSKDADRTLALLKHGANRAGVDTSGNTPLLVAIYETPLMLSQQVQPDWTDIRGYVECDQIGAIVHMPAHKNRSFVPDRWESQVANHEMVHAALCQQVGMEQFKNTPVWFHEGTATHRQANNIEGWFVKAGSKLIDLTQGEQTQDPIEFCYFMPNVGLTTYTTSLNFTSSIEALSPGSTDRIIRYLAHGWDFPSAFTEVMGTDCPSLYQAMSN